MSPTPDGPAGDGLAHFDERGAARMVDVGAKPETRRRARAAARVVMREETLRRVLDRRTEKGDVLEVARLAGIMGAKRTPDLIPLCHPLALDAVTVELRVAGDVRPGTGTGTGTAMRTLEIICDAQVTARTGVEMEAMTGAAVAALTVYDMVKGIDREVAIADLRLLEKSGGRSGSWRRAEGPGEEGPPP